MRSARWPGGALASAPTSPISSRWRSSVSSDSRPVTASMRRTPAATPPSDVTAKRPMSPVARTWVPPHSSWLTSPTVTTRTLSPYFSPKSAMAPPAMASSVLFTSVATGMLASTCSLTRRSIVAQLSRETAPRSARSRSAGDPARPASRPA